MRHRGNVRALHVKLIDAEEVLLVRRHGATAAIDHVGDEQHIGTVVIELKPVRHVFAQN